MPLLTSVLLAVHRTGESRAYWLGFALFGWAYLVMSLVPPIEARLPTTKVLARLDPSSVRGPGSAPWSRSSTSDNPSWARPAARRSPSCLEGRTSVNGHLAGRRLSLGSPRPAVPAPVRGGTAEDFVRIGHSLLALVLALVGGSLSRRLYACGAIRA